MKRILLYLSTAALTFFIGVSLPAVYIFKQNEFRSSPAGFDEARLSILLPKQSPVHPKEPIHILSKQLTQIGCWNGSRGGRLKITSSKIFDLVSKESSDYRLFSVRDLDNRKEFVLKAKKKNWKSFLSKFITITFYENGGIGISSYESVEDLLADNFHGAGQFEEVPCK
jgi:hypothetical protein